MDAKTFSDLMLAYNAVYDDEMREEYLREDYSFIDGLDDEEISDVVEEVIYELIEEGYDVDEVEELFEDTFITEAKVTMGRGDEAGGGKVTTGTGSLRAAKARLASRKSAKREERKEKIKSAARGVLSGIKKGVERAAKKVGIGAEKAKRSMMGRDRSAERAQVRSKAKMTAAARKGIRKAVTGRAEPPKVSTKGWKTGTTSGAGAAGTVRSKSAGGSGEGPSSTGRLLPPAKNRKDETGSTGAGAAGTVRSRSAGGSGDGPSSTGRALPPEGATSAPTKRGTKRSASAIKGALTRAKTQGRKAMSLAAGFDIFDVVSGFLISEGIAEDINEAAWLMANEITEEQIDEIMGLFGKKKEEPPLNPAGRSMTSTPKKLPYKVDTRRPEISVTTYGKGGRSETFKTRGPVR